MTSESSTSSPIGDFPPILPPVIYRTPGLELPGTGLPDFSIPSIFKIEELEVIKVKYLVDGMEPLGYIGEGKSDWVDLRASEDMRIWKGEFTLIPLGIAMELPKGYEALLAPRGSSFKHWGLIQTNSLGIVDESYCGDNDMWYWPTYATKTCRIHKNDRVCQFRIIKHQPVLTFQTVDSLDNPDRSGFGSTGKQ